MKTRTRVLSALSAALLTLGLAACGGSDDAADGPVELVFWSWAPGIENVVETWNAENPDIQVTVNKQDGGDPAVTKLLTAIKAGKGAPDLMQVEYQKIPTLVSADALADISEQVSQDALGQFTDAEREAVTLGGDAVYAVPQDTAPLALFYRADVFEELGLQVPTTWEEYAATARRVHDSDPDRYLGTFSSNDAGLFTGLAQQAGASWWGIDGQTWEVAIDDEATRRVADFWGGLVEEGAIDNQPMYTPAWNKALNDGDQVGWVSAVWAPGVLEGNAASTAGTWEMAPLPTWDGQEATGTWGGSTTSVTSQSEHAEQAAEFITWLNTDPEGIKGLIEESGLYPAAQAGQELLTEPPAFFSNQADFYEVAAAANQSVNPFTYGPNVNAAFNSFNDEFGKAAQSRSRQAFLDALASMQTATVSDLQDSGFDVAG